MKNTHQHLALVLVVVVSLICCTSLVFVSVKINRNRRNIKPSEAGVKIIETGYRHKKVAPQQYQEVHIPFVMEDDRLITTTTIGNKTLPAIVDTGTANVVVSAHTRLIGTTKFKDAIEGSRAEIKSTFRGLDGTVLHGHMKLLPCIKIGGYAVRTVGSVELNHFNNSPNQDYVILGNSMFSHVVLTIDTQKHEIIVRTQEFDPAHQPLKWNAVLLNFYYAQGNLFSPGVPVIVAKIKGTPIHLILDTGLDRVLLTRDTARMLTSHQTAPVAMTGSFTVPRRWPSLTGINLSLGSVKLMSQNVVIFSSSPGGTQGSIGMPLLRACRVTIDYPRQKILLEPFKPTSPPQ